MRTIIIGLFRILVVITAAFPVFARAELSPMSELRSQFYSQNTYDDRSRDFVSQNKLWLSLPHLLPLPTSESFEVASFIGARFDQDTRSTAREKYADNRASPVAGLKSLYRPLGVGAFAEALLNDTQITAYHYGFWPLTTTLRGPFFETYSDVSQRGSWNGNTILAHWSKLGTRLIRERKFELDVFPELELHRDVAGWAYENYTDLRFGTRATYRISQEASLAASVTGASGLYQGDREFATPLKALLVFAMDSTP